VLEGVKLHCSAVPIRSTRGGTWRVPKLSHADLDTAKPPRLAFTSELPPTCFVTGRFAFGIVVYLT
jgi:hypothetical protein